MKVLEENSFYFISKDCDNCHECAHCKDCNECYQSYDDYCHKNEEDYTW